MRCKDDAASMGPTEYPRKKGLDWNAPNAAWTVEGVICRIGGGYAQKPRLWNFFH